MNFPPCLVLSFATVGTAQTQCHNRVCRGTNTTTRTSAQVGASVVGSAAFAFALVAAARDTLHYYRVALQLNMAEKTLQATPLCHLCLRLNISAPATTESCACSTYMCSSPGALKAAATNPLLLMPLLLLPSCRWPPPLVADRGVHAWRD